MKNLAGIRISEAALRLSAATASGKSRSQHKRSAARCVRAGFSQIQMQLFFKIGVEISKGVEVCQFSAILTKGGVFRHCDGCEKLHFSLYS